MNPINSFNPINPFEYNLRKTHQVLNIGGENVPRVISDLNSLDEVDIYTLSELGYTYFKESDKWGISDFACDYIDIGKKEIDFKIPGTLGVIQDFSVWKHSRKQQHYPLLDINQYLNEENTHPVLNFLYITLSELSDEIIGKTQNDSTVVLLIDTWNMHGLAEQRSLFIKLINAQSDVPVIIGRAYGILSVSDLQLYSSTDIGGLFIDGLGDGLYLGTDDDKTTFPSIGDFNRTSFGILQATRTRITKTEYISCPSCGRTLFDLQEVTARIRSKTQHLKGLKIGVMGCIVNGPGEMADADYGYVGTGVEKISLYKKHDVIKKDIPMNIADEALIELIKENGDWIDP